MDNCVNDWNVNLGTNGCHMNFAYFTNLCVKRCKQGKVNSSHSLMSKQLHVDMKKF